MRTTTARAANRVWRWGNTTKWQGWRRSSWNAEASEVSAEPIPLELAAGGSTLSGVRAVSCGAHHSGFIDESGDVFTYGSNTFSRLGHDGDGEEPQQVKIPEPCVSLDLGSWHSAAVGESGKLYTWGYGGSFLNSIGGCGHGSSGDVSEPRVVEKLAGEKVVKVSCGQQQTLVLTESGAIFAFGKGENSRLGMGDSQDVPEPEENELIRDLRGAGNAICDVSAGLEWGAVRTQTGGLFVWGRNGEGQLGLGEESMGDMYSSEGYPRIVPFLENKEITIERHDCGDAHIISVANNGAIYIWGMRTWLEPHLLTGAEGSDNHFPDIASIAAGRDYSYILGETGVLYTVGSKSSGCLGMEKAKNAIVPRALSPKAFGNEKVVSIACGRTRCLAVTDPDVLIATSEEERASLQASAGANVTVELVEVKTFGAAEA